MGAHFKCENIQSVLDRSFYGTLGVRVLLPQKGPLMNFEIFLKNYRKIDFKRP